VDQRSGTYVLQKSYAEQRLYAISFARLSGPGMKLGYARVSTEDQRLEIQRTRLTEAGCGRLFEEKISSTARQRPVLERLLEELRAGDILVVTRLDRLARSTSELLRLAAVIAGKNAGLQSLEEPWADTTTPAGRMVLTVFAGVAEFERALIRRHRQVDAGDDREVLLLLGATVYAAALAPVSSPQIAKACARTARYSVAGR